MLHPGSIAALVLAVAAGWTDWRTRRIPNFLTVSGFALGLVLGLATGGWSGLLAALAGAGVALLVLLPLVLLRGLGAGDWKLMGALGSLLGTQSVLVLLWLSVMVAGLMAIVQVTRLRRWKQVGGNLVSLVNGFLIFGPKAHPDLRIDSPRAISVPFGTAVALAAVFAFLLPYAMRLVRAVS